MTLQKVKILIVDDEKNIREVIREYASLDGYDVMEEFYATSIIYGVLMARFIYANHKEGKKLENDKVKIIK